MVVESPVHHRPVARAECLQGSIFREKIQSQAVAARDVQAVLGPGQAQPAEKAVHRGACEDGVTGEERTGGFMEKEHRAIGVTTDVNHFEAPSQGAHLEGLVHGRASRESVLDATEGVVVNGGAPPGEARNGSAPLQMLAVSGVAEHRAVKAITQPGRVARVVGVPMGEQDGGEITRAGDARSPQAAQERQALERVPGVDEKASPLGVPQEPDVGDSHCG